MKSGPGTYSCFCQPGWKGSGIKCQPTVNSTDEEQQRRIVASSKAIIEKVRQIRLEEDRKLRLETDQEHAERISKVEERISTLLKQRERAEKAADNQVDNLEHRVEMVAQTALLIDQEKKKQTLLINSLKAITAKQDAATVAAMDVTNNAILKENADALAAESTRDAANALLLAAKNQKAALPPSPSSPSNLTPDGLIKAKIVPAGSIQTLPVIVEDAVADVVPIIAKAVIAQIPVIHQISVPVPVSVPVSVITSPSPVKDIPVEVKPLNQQPPVHVDLRVSS